MNIPIFTEYLHLTTPDLLLKRKRMVLIFITDKNGNILLGKKTGFYPDKIARMIGGGIDPEENPYDAAVRELHEETGLVATQESLVPLCIVRILPMPVQGDLQTDIWIFGLCIPTFDTIQAGDDVTGIAIYTEPDYMRLLHAMEQLPNDSANNTQYSWFDWGKMHAKTHGYAMQCIKKH